MTPGQAEMENGRIAPELAQALVDLAADMPAAPKDAENPHFGSRFASLQSIRDTAGPVLQKHGFALVQRTAESIEFVTLETMLIHKSGHFLSSRLLMPVAQKGNPQAYGSALSYARRYGASAILWLVTEDDDDGNAAAGKNGKPAAAPPRPAPPSPQTTRRPLAGAGTAPAPADSQVWYGIIETIKEKSGTSKTTGKPWTLWQLEGASGERFGTFDRRTKETAEFCLGSLVKIAWTSGPKGARNVFSIEAADGDDATATMPEDGDEVPF